jgi:hypothetical protein
MPLQGNLKAPVEETTVYGFYPRQNAVKDS